MQAVCDRLIWGLKEAALIRGHNFSGYKINTKIRIKIEVRMGPQEFV